MTVAVHTRRKDAHLGEFPRLRDHLRLRRLQIHADLHAAARRHLQHVPQHSKSRHIRARVHLMAHHHVPRRPVQRHHDLLHPLRERRTAQLRLGRRRQDADSQGLGINQHIPRLCPGIGQNPVRTHKSGDRKAVFGLFVVNTVAARDHGACLIDFGVTAPQDLVHVSLVHVLRDHHDIERQLGLTAHCVDVGQRVGRRNCPKSVRIVRDRREEIHCLNDRQLLADLIDRRVVTLVKTHKEVFICMHLQVAQKGLQLSGADFGAAAGTFCEFGQFDRISHL